MRRKEELNLQSEQNYSLTLEKAGAINALRKIREICDRIDGLTDEVENDDFLTGGVFWTLTCSFWN